MSRAVVGTIGEHLVARRRALFVARRAELELFARALDDGDFAVLHLSGPGGVGKTAVLDAYADAGRDAGCCVVRLDGRDLQQTPRAVLEALSGQVEIPADDGPISCGDDERLVLLVDGYERVESLDGWFREQLLPRLPSSAITVLAGRAPARPEWRADPAWSERLRVVTLRNLSSDDARAYLERRGVPTERHADVVALTHGHPLALALVVDVLARDPEHDLSAELPGELVPRLLQHMVADAPSATHRRALEISAVARFTTEELLRHVLGEPQLAHTTYAWLQDLSCVENAASGLVPHDLARDLLDAELRRRDPEGYREVFRGVQAHTMSRVLHTDGREQQRAIGDLKYCFRSLRSVAAPVAWGSFGDHYPEVARPEEHAEMVAAIRDAEGEESARVAEHWLARQPDAFHVVRGPGDPVSGVIVLLDLTAASSEDRVLDPGTAAAWRHVEASGPPRPHEVVTHCRFVVDAAAYQDPSPTLNAVPILTLQRQLTTRGLAWDFLTLAEPERWEAFFAAADLPRVAGADFDSSGGRFGTFGHDFRVVPVAAMIQRWIERALADDSFLQPVEREPELLVLAHPEFDAAVRQAMRDLHREDLLRRNPLSRARVVAGDGSRRQPLADVLREAVATLATDSRDDRLWRAVQATYVSASRTQEAAAAVLGLPYSTYRRHLSQGMDRVVAALWRRETGLDD